MKRMNEFQSKAIRRIDELFELEEYQEAFSLGIENFTETMFEDEDDIDFHMSLICRIIDLSEKVQDLENLVKASILIETNLNKLQLFYASWSLEYNLGNAKQAQFNIKRNLNSTYLKPEMAELLIEAKNHFWKAYKLSEGKEPWLLTNLANSLSTCSRLTEALYYYDEALKKDEYLVEALFNRAKCLNSLGLLSGNFSIRLFQEISYYYQQAVNSGTLPQAQANFSSSEIKRIDSIFKSNSAIAINPKEDFKQTQREFKNHSPYRKFCLNNKIGLSEHSLYCVCNGAREDNLTISIDSEKLSKMIVLKHESVLNRLKVEFDHARRLFYSVMLPSKNKYEQIDRELCLSKMYYDEVLGSKSEDLRSCFKQCFGILDKIALALCDLFKIQIKNENIYFHSFWKNKNLESFWGKVNKVENYSLHALYYQAIELNLQTGVWKEFKEWRNALEHNFLVLINDIDKSRDGFGFDYSTLRVLRVEFDYFEEKTKQLLQFTRAAIFNYVFCVREEVKNDSRE